VKLVEDGTGSVFDVRGSEDSDGVFWEGFGEVCTTFVIFESRNTGSHWNRKV